MSFASSTYRSATLDQPISTTPPAVASAATDEACDMCAHPLSAHDPIARRYCVATSANALTRGCICA